MIIHTPTTAEFDISSFDDLLQKIAEIQAALSTIADRTHDHQTAPAIRETARLTNWLQADVRELRTAYEAKHGAKDGAA